MVDDKALGTEFLLNAFYACDPDQTVGKVGIASISQAEQAVAKAAFPQWSRTPAQERAHILRRAADLRAQRRAKLSAWIEVAKPLREADAEVSEAIDFCRYYAKEMEQLSQPILPIYLGKGIPIWGGDSPLELSFGDRYGHDCRGTGGG